MIARLMHRVGRLVIAHPGWVAGFSLGLTLFLYAHIHHLRTQTDLTDMFGKHDPQWQVAGKIGKELGYGNQLFVIIEAPTGNVDRTDDIQQARSGLQPEEMLNLVRYYTWNFPAFTLPTQVDGLQQRLAPEQIRQNVHQAAMQLETPFSSMGASYFIADPLGLLQVEEQTSQGLSQFASFDLNWGSGNRFLSKDHQSLLIIAEPRQSAVDYNSAAQVVQWTREHLQTLSADPAFRNSGIRTTQAGAYVYAEQDHRFIEHNIRMVTWISLLGNLALCLFIYPSIPMLLLSLLPAGLGILCTTGIASYYPGEVNLISLAFIAILGGLGDDQIVHFFNRTPQEWAKGGTYDEALLRTFETTGLSIVLCIVTAATATVALATSGFKALAEFGFILTVGMFMMMFHTLLTVPALMQLWRRHFQPVAPKAITFRFLPFVADKIVDFVGRHARAIVACAAGVFLLSLMLLPSIRLGGHFEITGGKNDPADIAQQMLSTKFGMGGSPHLLLIAGSQQEVLRRAEKLTEGLELYQHSGAIRSILSPTSLRPSAATQRQRAALLAQVDFTASAHALQTSLQQDGFELLPCSPILIGCSNWPTTPNPSRWKRRQNICPPECSTTAFAERRMAATWPPSPMRLRTRATPR